MIYGAVAKSCIAALLPPLLALALGCAPLRVMRGERLAGFDSAEPAAAASPLASIDQHGKSRLRFLVFGDAGTGGLHQRRVGEAMHRVCEAAGGCDFALVTGDNIYPTGVKTRAQRPDDQFREKFEEPYRGFGRFDFWLVTGNHDWLRRGSALEEVRYSSESERWRMPAFDYAVPRLPGWLTIYGLDSTLIEKGAESGQLGRARRALCEQEGWSLVFSHHGLYTAGTHGDRQGKIREIHEALLPLIRECGVQLHFAGHDHLQAHITSPDFDQIVQGAGGRRLHRLRSRPGRPADVEVLEAQNQQFGFAVVEVEPEELWIRFYDLGAGDEAAYCRRFELGEFFGGSRSRPCG